MLVLTRKQGERIKIGQDVVVTVCRIAAGKVRIGIEAPDRVHIVRCELLDRLRSLKETPK